MNRIFRSVWNDVTRTWVAVAECVRSQGRSAGGSGEDSTVAAVPLGRPAQRGIQRPRPKLLALEARLMFDGAAAVTVAEAMTDPTHHTTPEAVVAQAPAVALAEQAPPAMTNVAPTPQRIEIVFIASNVTDPQSLLNGLQPGAEVHVLDAAQDGLAQMAGILAERSGIDAIHVLSHGEQGAIGLGSLALSIGNLSQHSAELATIGQALKSDADILLYGCNTGAGSDGAAFVAALAQATQADIAASLDSTGAATLGGNWQLEVTSGTIQSDLAILGRSVEDYAHLLPNTAPTIGGAVAGQAVRDSAVLNPFSAVTITDPDGGASETVTITLDSAAKGVFTAASLTASGFSTADGGTTYTRAAGTPAALQTAIRALVYDPTDNRVAVGSTETTTFTISVNDGIASPVTNSTTTVVAMSVDYGTRSFGTSGTSIYFRPGDTSATWTLSGMYDAAYYKVDFNPIGLSAGDWLLTRGKFQFSTNSGTTWTDYNDPTTIPNAGGAVNYLTVSGRLWRYVDNSRADTTTSNNIGYAYHVVNGGGSSATGSSVVPDNAPTDLSSDKNYFLSGTSQGTAVATLTPTDTGDMTGGSWAIDSQSVPNLFTIAPTGSNTNTAVLSIGSGTLPAAGQVVTVTARYYDRFQTNNGTGTGMSGEGFSKQFTFTVIDEQSRDLNFGDDLKVSTTTANDQRNASVTTLSNGNFVAVWQSAGQGGEASNRNGIYGQIYTAAGVPVGSEFAITTAGNGVDETTPVVTALNAGRFVVAYNTTPGANGLDIAYRLVEANGTVGSQLVANTTVAGTQTAPALTTLTDGSFVAAWVTSGGIRAQKFNAADGSKNGTEVTIDASGSDESPMLASLSDGQYVVAWGDAGSYDIKAVRSNALGTIIDVSSGGQASANVTSTGTPMGRVAGLSGGGFVVAWSTYDAGYGQTDIVFQRYNNSGVAQGSTVQANATTAAGTYKDLASIAALSGGGFVVGWQSDVGDYDLQGIFGRRFSASGVAVDATDFEINQFRRGNQNSPVMTALASDMFATVWVDNTSDTTSAGVEGRVLLPETARITSATYDASTGVLAVTAANLTPGDTIVPGNLTLTGEGGVTYTLTTSNTTASSATAFTVTLNATDRAAVNLILNKTGTSSTSGTTFNLAGASNWDSTTSAAADATNAVTVSNVAAPALTGATYNAATGVLSVTGTGFLSKSGAANDIDVTQLTLTGEGGATYALTTNTSNVEVTSGTSFTVTLGSMDRAAVNLLMNQNGTTATDASTAFNLAGASGWNAGSNLGAADLTGNAITVSNVAVPTITSATYDATTGMLVVSGTGFLVRAGSANDIDVSKLSILAEGGTVSLSTSSNVDITSGTSLTVTLSATDRQALALLTNQVGTRSTDGVKYNLAAAEDWALGAASVVTTADIALNDITVSNIARPTITSATWTQSTGVLVVTGTHFVTKAGAANDIDVTKLTLSGDSTAYTLTSDTASVDITSATSFTLTLGSVDRAALLSRINKAGTSSTGNTPYNLAAAEDWIAGATGATANLVDVDLTGNGITADGVNVSPTLGGAVASQAVNDNASVSPFSGFTLTDPDVGAVEAVSITLDAAAKGAFTSASLTASGFSTADGGLTYTHAAGTPAALQAAIRQLVYQPGSNRANPGSTETTTFTVSVDDGFGAVTNSTTTVVSTSVNDAPALTTPTAASYTDTAAWNTFSDNAGTLAGSDVDTGQTLSYGIAGGTVSGGVSTLAGTHGSLSVNTTSGAYTYTPSASAINALTADTTDTFTVNVSDGTASVTATYTVNLTAANDTPTLATPTAASYTDTAALNTFSSDTGTLAGSDVDTSQTLSYGIAGGTVSGGVSTLAGTHGSLSVNTTSGAYTYTPSAGAINALTADTTDTFTVNVSDGTASATATYTVNLTAANDTPTLATPAAAAYTDTAALDTFSNSTGTLAGSDADTGQTLSYGIAGGTVSGGVSTLAGTHGSLSVNTTSGAYTYTPSAGAINALTADTTDTFTVSVSDGTASATATYTVNLTAANDTPTLATPTAASYTDTAAWNTFSDNTGTLAGGEVDTGQTLSYGIAGGTVSGGVSTLAGTHGSLSVNTTSGAYTYTPSASAINALTADATDTFTVNVSDGTASTTATYTVNLTAANDTPTLATPTAASYTDTAAWNTFSDNTGTLAGGEVDTGQTLSYGIAGGTVSGGVSTLAGTHGSLSVNTTSGAYTYTPSAIAINALTADTTDTFTVNVSDGTASATATYTVNLTAANDTPTLATPTAASYADTSAFDSFSNSTGTLAGNDADAGQALTYGIAGGGVSGGVSTLAGTYGSLSVNTASGAYTYTPSAMAINALTAGATDTFTVTVSDGTASITATYTVNLTEANDPPTLATPAAAVYSDTATLDTFNNALGMLAGSDVDVGQTLSYGIVGGTVSGGVSTLAGNYGSLAVNTVSGTYTYTPGANAVNALADGALATDTFTVSVSDGTATTTAAYTVSFQGADDIANLTPTTVALDEDDAPLATQGVLTFSDVDSGRNFVPQASTAGLYGSFSVDSAGAWQYNPSPRNDFAAGAVYVDTFQVTHGDGATTSVSINFQGRNDAAVIGGATTATTAKTTGTTLSGMLTVTDIDSPAEFLAQTVTDGQYGDFSLGANGAWTYTLNRDTTRVMALKSGETLTDEFTVTSADGTNARVVVTILGNDDFVIAPPVLTPVLPELAPVVTAPVTAASSFTLPLALQAVGSTPAITERAAVEKAAFASPDASFVNAAAVETRTSVVTLPPVANDSAGLGSVSLFRVAVSADISAPLAVFKGIPDQTIPLQSSTISFAIPADAFMARPNASLSVEVWQTDGQALPTWLKFDSNTGKFRGTVPPDAPDELVITVIVRDAEGGEAATTFRVKLLKEQQGRHGLSEQIRLAAKQPPLFDRASVPRRAA